MPVARADVEPAPRLGEVRHETRARSVLLHLVREDGLRELFAEPVVKVAVVKRKPFERKARILEDVTARFAAPQDELAGLALVVVADLHHLREARGAAEGAVGARGFEESIGAAREELLVDGTELGRADARRCRRRERPDGACK